MSIEPSCHFCGVSDKGRCKSKEAALGCSRYTPDPSEVFDFGFSFSDNEEEKAIEAIVLAEQASEEVKALQSANKNLDNRVKKLYNAILPFLDNLCANPDKPNIHWPNRVEKIQEFKVKLAKIAQGKET